MVRSKQQFVPFGNRNFIEVIGNFPKARSEYLLSTAIIEKFTQRLCILYKIHEKEAQQSIFKGYLHRQLLTLFWHDLNGKCNVFMYRTHHIVSWRFPILLGGGGGGGDRTPACKGTTSSHYQSIFGSYPLTQLAHECEKQMRQR